MSNLGLYQEVTKFMKKCGGPIPAIALTLATGYAIGRPLEAGIKKTYRKVSELTKRTKQRNNKPLEVYEITCSFIDSQGLCFQLGDRFQVLERDGDAVLINKLDDPDTPYFVSANFLCKISNYST